MLAKFSDCGKQRSKFRVTRDNLFRESVAGWVGRAWQATAWPSASHDHGLRCYVTFCRRVLTKSKPLARAAGHWLVSYKSTCTEMLFDCSTFALELRGKRMRYLRLHFSSKKDITHLRFSSHHHQSRRPNNVTDLGLSSGRPERLQNVGM